MLLIYKNILALAFFSLSLFLAKQIAVWLKNNWLWVVVIVVGIIFLALAVHFTYKYKRNHSWEESKAAVRAKTMRIGKSMRGPSGKRRKTGGHNSGAYNSGKCH